MTMAVDQSAKLMRSPEFLATLFDAIPCGVVVVDEDRCIRAANRFFENAVGLEPGLAVGSCEGHAIGCLNAENGHRHPSSTISEACQTCEARRLAVKALEMSSSQRGRAHFQINVGGRLEDLTLTLNAAPFE